MKAAANNLTPVVLELGGKDPFIVTKGANVKQVCCIAVLALDVGVPGVQLCSGGVADL